YSIRNSNPAIYRSARQKLLNWEISDQQIERIIQNGKPQTDFIIRAYRSGYVIERNIAVDDHIIPVNAMFIIADLSKVWVIFQAYERDILGLEQGDSAHFTLAAYPGRQFDAKVTYIDPIINKERRTVSVRTEV